MFLLHYNHPGLTHASPSCIVRADNTCGRALAQLTYTDDPPLQALRALFGKVVREHDGMEDTLADDAWEKV